MLFDSRYNNPHQETIAIQKLISFGVISDSQIYRSMLSTAITVFKDIIADSSIGVIGVHESVKIFISFIFILVKKGHSISGKEKIVVIVQLK